MVKKFTHHYTDQDYYIQKKAEYSLFFALVMMSTIVFIMITEAIISESLFESFIKAIISLLGFLLALMLIYYGKYENGVNIMILLGFGRMFMLLGYKDAYQFYMMVSVVMLAINVVAIKRYQVILTTLGSLIIILAQTAKIASMVIEGDLDKKAFMEALIAVYLFIAILLLLRSIRDIIDREIYERRALSVLAEQDALTSLYNRRKIAECFSNLQKQRHSFQLLLFDIDDFKMINDRHGHSVGDEVLVELSRLVDTKFSHLGFSRWGGEEFLLLLEEGNSHAEEVRQAVMNHNFGHQLLVTISAGMTTVSKSDSLATAIKRADDALYASKRRGKNCVSIV